MLFFLKTHVLSKGMRETIFNTPDVYRTFKVSMPPAESKLVEPSNSSRSFPALTWRRSAAVSGKASGMSATLPRYGPTRPPTNPTTSPFHRWRCNDKRFDRDTIKRTHEERCSRTAIWRHSEERQIWRCRPMMKIASEYPRRSVYARQ